MEIRDPIHGPIAIDPRERPVLEHPLVRRLRRIRQLGFAEATFPGAVHTRFLHSVGSMHLAGRAFEMASRDLPDLSEPERRRLRTAVRLAALLHDLGHGPLSHTGEGLLPPLGALSVLPPGSDPSVRATHEDMTRALVLGSDLKDLLDRTFRDQGVGAIEVAALLGWPGEDPFRLPSGSALPLLRQLISGEMDADRMDYLRRDSLFTGASYGHFDLDWLLSHLGSHRVDGQWHLALESPALFAFEDFLLARHHMFLMVYAHRRTLCYQRLLDRFIAQQGPGLQVPADPDSFVRCDDDWLWSRLAASDSIFARRIIEYRPLPLAVEVWDDEADALEDRKETICRALPPSCEWIRVEFEFSREHPGGRRGPRAEPLWVRLTHPGAGRSTMRMDDYSDLYLRQARRRRVVRIHCEDPDDPRVAEVLSRTAATE
ncbi:HD domain-containing protein [Myxococcota bacterium]|nr:HD domain-containing protein [Myxococcota bacterium]